VSRALANGDRPLIGVSASVHDFGDYSGVGVHRPILDAGGLPVALPQLVDAISPVLAAVDDVDRWAEGNSSAVAAQLSAGIGIPAPVLEIALKRQTYGIKPLDDATVAAQQKIADTFYALGLLPKPITVSAVVWRTGS